MDQNKINNSKNILYKTHYTMATNGSNSLSNIKYGNTNSSNNYKLLELRVTEIWKWVNSLFMQTVKIGERLLEDGHLTMAAEMFANATLLKDQPKLFVITVQRVYPYCFNRLYILRLRTMGYNHLFLDHDERNTGYGSPNTD